MISGYWFFEDSGYEMTQGVKIEVSDLSGGDKKGNLLSRILWTDEH